MGVKEIHGGLTKLTLLERGCNLHPRSFPIPSLTRRGLQGAPFARSRVMIGSLSPPGPRGVGRGTAGCALACPRYVQTAPLKAGCHGAKVSVLVSAARISPGSIR